MIAGGLLAGGWLRRLVTGVRILLGGGLTMSAVPEYTTLRPYASPPSDLASLKGTRVGVVRLPKRLDWGPPHHYDVAVARERRAMYEVVLQEAATTAEVEKFVNGDLLAADWQELRLPARVRTRWEAQLPALTGAGRPVG